MHSSRKRAARLLSVSHSNRWGKRGGCLPKPPFPLMQTPPPRDRMTDACENITLPQTSFAGSNNVANILTTCRDFPTIPSPLPRQINDPKIIPTKVYNKKYKFSETKKLDLLHNYKNNSWFPLFRTDKIPCLENAFPCFQVYQFEWEPCNWQAIPDIALQSQL